VPVALGDGTEGSQDDSRIDRDGKTGLASQVPRDAEIKPITEGRRRATGKWITGLGNVGLAVCRLEMMTDIRVNADGGTSFTPEMEFVVAGTEDGQTSGGIRAKAFVPEWLRRRIVGEDL